MGKGRCLREAATPEVAVLSFGPIGNIVADAIEAIAAQGAAAPVPADRIGHYDLRFAKPLDEAMILDVARRYRRLIIVEDGVRQGGIGSAVLELLADRGVSVPVVRLGLPDQFVEHGTVAQLQHICGIDCEAITKAITES